MKNVFNSANWNLIRKSLAKVGIPAYPAAIVDSYLTERKLWYDTDDGPQECLVSAGVPQGCVLGPLLWNTMYNDVLNLPLPREATVVGYVDDIALVVVAKHLEDAELYLSEAIGAVKELWSDTCRGKTSLSAGREITPVLESGIILSLPSQPSNGDRQEA